MGDLWYRWQLVPQGDPSSSSAILGASRREEWKELWEVGQSVGVQSSRTHFAAGDHSPSLPFPSQWKTSGWLPRMLSQLLPPPSRLAAQLDLE